nr:copia protein [Tanacetum cinerariifolium]
MFQRSRDDKNKKGDRNDLDAMTQNILLENVQNHQKTRTKKLLSEILGMIVVKKMMRSKITKDGKVICRGITKKGLYVMKLGNKPEDQICLATINENSMLWHRRLGHVNMRLIQSLASKELVRNLPKLKFDQHFCDACKIGKQAHASHKANNIVSTTRCLELLHMDLFGPSSIRSYGGNRYTLVIVDDYSRAVLGRTPYELLKCRKPTLDYFRVFRSYSQDSKAYIILNKHTMKFEESLNVIFDETPPPSKTSPLVDDDLDKEEAIKVTEKKNLENDIEDETLEIDEIVNIKESMNHPLENVIGKLNQRTLRSQAQNLKMLKKFALEESKPMKTPISSDTKLTKDEEYESVDSTKYRGIKEAPKTSHLEAVKRIFRYIKGTTHLVLWYPKGTGIETVVYADFDHAGDYVDRKSTSGICTFVGCCLTSWFLIKQTALAISTIEAEYVSTEKACQQALWMKQALIDYDVRLNDIPILCDNKGRVNRYSTFVTSRHTLDISFNEGTLLKLSSSLGKMTLEEELRDEINLMFAHLEYLLTSTMNSLSPPYP